ncbi:MAG: phytanoyl-CoA dioxygenase family protein [Bryobacterales bacterium]|nr:phytanoyl-CoA dioxygenase family protein [Bryobacterales bacterium]
MRQAQSDFREHGFAVLRQYLNGEEVAALRGAFENFRLNIAPTLDKRAVMYEDYSDADTIKQSHSLHLEPTLAASMHTGKIHALAEACIGPAIPQNVEYFDKPPGRNHETPPHQDGYYFCLTPNEACTVWIPLAPIVAAGGALTYVRGSHRLGVRPHEASNLLGFSQGLAEDPRELGEAVICEVEPGDVLIHHSLTVHYAGANRTAQRRPVIAYTFFSNAAQPDVEAKARYDAALRRQHTAKGLLPTLESES